MPFQFFVVPVHDSGSATQELNSFLVSHKVLAVERQFVAAGPDSFWAICVDHWQVAGGAARPDGARRNVSTATRIDYKDRLSPADFKLFLKLREWRKQTAQAEAVPVYAIFTNEQLALEFKPQPYINRTDRGIDFLGCRVWRQHITLSRRSRLRFRRRLAHLERDYQDGIIDEHRLQQRATALVAFARAGGAASWRFRAGVIQSLMERDRGARTA